MKKQKNTPVAPVYPIEKAETVAFEAQAQAQADPFAAAPLEEEEEAVFFAQSEQGNPLAAAPLEEEEENTAILEATAERLKAQGIEVDKFDIMQEQFQKLMADFYQSKELEKLRADKEKAEAEKAQAEAEAEALRRELEGKKEESAEQIVQRAEKALKISSRIKFLQGKRQQLFGMIFTEDQQEEHLTLTDSKGQKFTVTNQELIGAIKGFIFSKIEENIEESTADLLAV